jgi:hypothetical protein
MNVVQSREELLTATERDEAEVERALGDLKRAVGRPFAVYSHVGDQLANHPLSWLAASVLIGFWLGGRNNGHGRL